MPALKILRAFFRAAAVAGLLVSFSFSVDNTGKTWIMWRDATVLAITLVGFALLMSAGWLVTTVRIGKVSVPGEQRGIRAEPLPLRPYNIFGRMALRTRAGLAVAVFLIFGTMGPLNALLTPPDRMLRPLEIILSTIGSGAISACFVMFGHRKLLLVFALTLCGLLLASVDPIATFLSGSPASHHPFSGDVLTLTRTELVDYSDQRAVIAAGGIVLLCLGYVMFIVLLSREGEQRSRLQTEMSLARGIQQTLIPGSTLTSAGGEAAGKTVPASEVGGDYFDFLDLADGRLAVFAADVTGHGVGAGILGAMTKSAFRAHLVYDPSPASVFAHLNATLVPLMEKKMFITAAYLLLDAARGSARIATAGHPAILRLGSHSLVEELRTPSLALGMNRNAAFPEKIVPCSPGDLFLLYTDGLLESVSPSGEQFGAGRVKALLTELRDLPPMNVCEALIERAEEFRGGKGASDDVTVVGVRAR